MSASSPARLYCTLVGAVLVIAGIIGFFYSAGFDTGVAGVAKDTDDVFGILAVNGWHNVVHILLGVLALVAAGSTYSASHLLPGDRPGLRAARALGLHRRRRDHPRSHPAQRRGQRAADPRPDGPRSRRGYAGGGGSGAGVAAAPARARP